MSCSLLNTFMRLDKQGLRAGREKHLLRGHFGNWSMSPVKQVMRSHEQIRINQCFYPIQTADPNPSYEEVKLIKVIEGVVENVRLGKTGSGSRREGKEKMKIDNS